LNLEWTKHLKTDKERKEFEDLLTRNTMIFGRLREIYNNKIKQLDTKDFSEKDFEEANWSDKQANRIGQRKAYHEMLDLIDFTKRIIKI
jgi:hypothetical protein